MSGGGDVENTSLYDYSAYLDGVDFDDFAACKFDGVGSFARVFLPTLYSLVFILGFFGNGLVVIVLIKHRNKVSLTDICLFNLAVSDLLFVLTLPFYAVFARVGEWIFGDFMCRLLAVSHTIGFFSSVFFIVVMSLDRYVGIVHSLTIGQYRNFRKTGMVVTIVVWILSSGVSLPAFFFTKADNNTDAWSCGTLKKSDAWLYNVLASNVMGLLIPMLVMIVCYARIIPTLKKMKTEKKYRVIKLIRIIVIAFFLLWVPYNICLLLDYVIRREMMGTSCTLEKNLKLAITVTEAFAYTHCCLNPVIYAFVSQRFMKRVKQLHRSWTQSISRSFADSSYRRGSVMSKSSETTPVFII